MTTYFNKTALQTMTLVSSTKKIRKIIHVDMDCFYAAIEIRDNPSLARKPVAVGGPSDKRGVICTCNYLAREYGVRSAMPTTTAYRLCNDLILLPVNMAKYREVAHSIHAIFSEFTDLVEPLSLDEAYLDVTNSPDYQGSATLIAKAIRRKIWQTTKLTASAGVAPNKFLAKIASGWHKPNGLFVIRPKDIDAFLKPLAVEQLYGVGKVTAEKLHRFGLKTCADIQQRSLLDLTEQLGNKLGKQLYEQCRGIDQRPVEPNRIRKSISVERTFMQDITNSVDCVNEITTLYSKLIQRIAESSAAKRKIKNQFLKIKYSDFTLKSMEIASKEINLAHYLTLFHQSYTTKKFIRLLGIGVHFEDSAPATFFLQRSLF